MRVTYPLTLTFKFLTISSYIRVVDATGALVSYVKQRAFRLREDVTIFAEEEQTRSSADSSSSRTRLSRLGSSSWHCLPS